jgi:hypothetical protein
MMPDPHHTFRHAPRVFFLGFAALALIIVVVGFTRTFIVPFVSGRFHAPSLVYIHGGLFFTWALLFVGQSLLARKGRLSLHKTLGWVGGLLAAAMIVFGLVVSLWRTNRELRAGQGDAAIAFLFGLCLDMVLFGALVSFGILARRRPDTHKRLMLLATITLLGAPLARIFIPHFDDPGIPAGIATAVLISALAVYDWMSRGRLHGVTLWGGLVVLIEQALLPRFGDNPIWLAVGAWLMRHVRY